MGHVLDFLTQLLAEAGGGLLVRLIAAWWRAHIRGQMPYDPPVDSPDIRSIPAVQPPRITSLPSGIRTVNVVTIAGGSSSPVACGGCGIGSVEGRDSEHGGSQIWQHVYCGAIYCAACFEDNGWRCPQCSVQG